MKVAGAIAVQDGRRHKELPITRAAGVALIRFQVLVGPRQLHHDVQFDVR
jgi:hypothetical protein